MYKNDDVQGLMAQAEVLMLAMRQQAQMDENKAHEENDVSLYFRKEIWASMATDLEDGLERLRSGSSM